MSIAPLGCPSGALRWTRSRWSHAHCAHARFTEGPRVPPGLGYAALHGTQWHPLYQDHQGVVRLYNAETGAVREGPWVNLRSQPHGMVFYANLETGDTRWLPPHLWMEGWISRPWRQHYPDGSLSVVWDSVFEGHRLAQALLPIALAL